MTHIIDAVYLGDLMLVLTPHGVYCKASDGRWLKLANPPPATPVRLIAKDIEAISIIDNGGYLWAHRDRTWQRIVDLPENHP